MPTQRTFQLDIDTKRYVNRVNVYRKLNGIGPLLPPDVADIDNFVVGLKDLGVWWSSVCWIFTSKHNIGTGTKASSIGGAISSDAALLNSPTWTSSGIQIVGTNNSSTNQGINTGVNQGKIFGTRAFYSSVFFINSASNEGRRIITCDIPATGNGGGIDDFDATYIRWLNTYGAGAIPKTSLLSFAFLSFGRGEAPFGVKSYLNTTSYSNSTSNYPSVSPTSNIGIGGQHLIQANGTPFVVASKSQTNAFLLATSIPMSFEQHKTIYALLKNSICKTLGLP